MDIWLSFFFSHTRKDEEEEEKHLFITIYDGRRLASVTPCERHFASTKDKSLCCCCCPFLLPLWNKNDKFQEWLLDVYDIASTTVFLYVLIPQKLLLDFSKNININIKMLMPVF